MELKRLSLCLALLAILGCIPGFAQGLPVRLQPDPYFARLAALPAPLTPQELIQASLVMSGADAQQLAADSQRLSRIVSQVQQAVGGIHDPYARGEAVLAFMFKNLLTRYSQPQARMDLLLSTGSFNCVSSAVLYMILARSVGLTVEGVSTPDHAFCTVSFGGRSVDVETTNQYGFDPGAKRSFRDAFGETGFVYVPPGNYALRKGTDGRGLLSFILQDRIALLERQQLFAEAVGLAADRYALLGTPEALADLTNEIANLGASLNNQGDYTQALEIVDSATPLYGQSPPLEKLASDLAHNEVLRLARAGEYAAATAFIESRLARGLLSAATAKPLETMVAQQRLYQAVTTMPFDRALAEVQASFKKGEIDGQSYRAYVASLYGRKAQETAASQGYLAAVGVIDEALKLIGSNQELDRARGIYLQDYVATVHNRFAALFNARNYAQARKVLDEGMAAVPGNPLLTQDLGLLRSAAGN